MLLFRTLIYLFFIVLFLISCKTDQKKSYAIADFDTKLQPNLTAIVANGVAQYDTTIRFIAKHASDEDLKHLCKSEHPILRAIAFEECLERPGFDHFKIIMENLSDTAVIAVNAGEWGIAYKKVSDFIIERAKWKDSIALKKTVEEIITKHNYLSSAYQKLFIVDTVNKFYPYIKDMAQREEEGAIEDYEIHPGAIRFEEKVSAVYALANFRKPEDIDLIKNILQTHMGKLNETLFKLMKDYPNDAYKEIFEKYYPWLFYRQLNMYHSPEIAIAFIECVASYKQSFSTKILSDILTRKQFYSYNRSDSSYIMDRTMDCIWENNCEEYKDLRKKITKIMREKQNMDERQLKTFGFLHVDSITLPRDTSKEPIHW